MHLDTSVHQWYVIWEDLVDEAEFYRWFTEMKSCYTDIIAITDSTRGCHYNNLRYRQ